MSKDIYPIFVDPDELQELFNILHKYADAIANVAKISGNTAVEEYNRAVAIINTILEKTEDAISPMKCLSKACIQSEYCYMPSQCSFVKNMKMGYKVARVNDDQVELYKSIGWELVYSDPLLKSGSKRHLMRYKV